jgi:putative transcriptional regulator
MIFFYFGGIVIKCHLSELMGKKKLKIVDLARETGLHRNTITLLYKEEAARVELETMEKLCIFFQCSVGDLFEFIPDEPKKPNGG